MDFNNLCIDLIYKIIHYIYFDYKIVIDKNFNKIYTDLNRFGMINKTFRNIINEKNYINKIIIKKFFVEHPFLKNLFQENFYNINFYNIPILKFRKCFLNRSYYLSNIGFFDLEYNNIKLEQKHKKKIIYYNEFSNNLYIGIDNTSRPFLVLNYHMNSNKIGSRYVVDCFYQFDSFNYYKWNVGSKFVSYFNRMYGFLSDYACFNKYSKEINNLINNKFNCKIFF